MSPSLIKLSCVAADAIVAGGIQNADTERLKSNRASFVGERGLAEDPEGFFLPGIYQRNCMPVVSRVTG